MAEYPNMPVTVGDGPNTPPHSQQLNHQPKSQKELHADAKRCGALRAPTHGTNPVARILFEVQGNVGAQNGTQGHT